MVIKKAISGRFEPHLQIVMAIFESADSCRRENNALRSILRKQGLSDRAVQGKVKRLLKKPDQDQAGSQLIQQACEETIKRFRDHDDQKLIAAIKPIPGIH